MVLLVVSVDVISHSVSNIASSCSVFFADLVSCLLLHIFSKWLFLLQLLHLVPKAGHSILLILVGGVSSVPSGSTVRAAVLILWW